MRCTLEHKAVARAHPPGPGARADYAPPCAHVSFRGRRPWRLAFFPGGFMPVEAAGRVRPLLVRLAAVALLTAVALPAAADTRLADAASRRDVAAVRALLTQKVDVNEPDVQGTPALHAAVRLDDVDIARLLLDAGADAKLSNRYGVAPLTLATGNGSPAMMRMLLDAGADPNAVDQAGETMLMIAARVG